MPKNMDRWEPILNSEAIYDSGENALEAGNKLVEEIKNNEEIP
jgi:hypothetical protein